MPNIRLALLGGFQLFAGTRILREPRAKKARALLAYLALHEGRVVSRDQLASLLWSYSDRQRARHSLSQAMSSIRRVFDGVAVGALALTNEDVRFDTAVLDTDAHQFAALAASKQLESLEHAAALYKGDLLEGLHINEPVFQAWLRAEQAHLNETAVTVLTMVFEAQAKKGQLDDAIGTALKLLALNPLHEQTHRALMRFYVKKRRTDAALRQFKILEKRLEQDLAAQPDAETRKLLSTITQNRTWTSTKPHAAQNDNPPTDDRPSIVVLPFVDYSDDRDPDHFADGLTDDLISDLSRVGGLLVIARNTSFTYKNRSVNIRQIAQNLGVEYVLEGSVHRSGGQMRVNVKFLDGKTGTLIWSDRFDRDIENVFLLQDEITGRIAAALRLELLRAECHRMRRGPPASLTAWGYAIQGWADLWTKPIRRDYTLEAKRRFDQALELDPMLALAWTGMARVQFISALYPFGIGERVDSFQRALKAAETAVTLDPRSAEAYAELGAALKTQFRYDQAEKAIQTAIELNPNYEEAFCNLAMLKQATGEPNIALPLFERSLALAPHLPTNGRRSYFIAQTHLLAGDYEQALIHANKSVVADDEFPGPHWIRACVFGWQDRKDLAETALAELVGRDEGLDTLDKVSRQYRYIANMEPALEGLLRAGMPER